MSYKKRNWKNWKTLMSILPNATHIHTLYCLHWPFVSTHSRNGLCYYYPHLCPISTHFTSWSALVIFQTSTEEKCCDSDHQRIDIKNVYMAHLKVGSAILQKDSWLLRLIASSSNTDENEQSGLERAAGGIRAGNETQQSTIFGPPTQSAGICQPGSTNATCCVVHFPFMSVLTTQA